MSTTTLSPASYVDIPRHVWDAVNNAIHASKIDGNVQPISLCYVAVRAALAASANRELLEALKLIVDNGHVHLSPEKELENIAVFSGVLPKFQEGFQKAIIAIAKAEVSA